MGAAFGAPESHAKARGGSTAARSPDSRRAAARSGSALPIPQADLVRPCPRDRPCRYCNGWGLYRPHYYWPDGQPPRCERGRLPLKYPLCAARGRGTSQHALCPPHRLRPLIWGVRRGGRACAKCSGVTPTHSAAAATCTARPLPTDRASPSLDATAAARGLALVDSGPFHVQQHPMVCVCTAREPGLKAGVAVSA